MLLFQLLNCIPDGIPDEVGVPLRRQVRLPRKEQSELISGSCGGHSSWPPGGGGRGTRLVGELTRCKGCRALKGSRAAVLGSHWGGGYHSSSHPHPVLR